MTLLERQEHPKAGTAASRDAAAATAAEMDAVEAPEKGFGRLAFLQVPFDTIGPASIIEALRLRQVGDRFAYVVTPNVDHVVRLAGRPDLLPAYRAAWISCCDSHPLCALALLLKLRLPHLTGADLVRHIFADVLEPGDRIVCIAADEALVGELSARFPQFEFVGYSPPLGFEDDPVKMADCVRFIRDNPGRFLFLGVGSPRSEQLAHRVQCEDDATGTALCIGAALEFLVGRKRRAPLVMRKVGLEWLHRLSSEPRRLWRRYVFSFAPLLRLFLRECLARRRS